MGQKIHPLGLRLGTTQSHDSIWFAQPRDYSENLQEDKIIRDCIKNYIQKTIRLSFGIEGVGLGRIKIKKRIDLIQVIIYMGLPKLLIEDYNEDEDKDKENDKEKDKPRRIEELETNVQKKVNCVNRKINIGITRISNIYEDEPRRIEELKTNVQSVNRKINIGITRIPNIYGDPNILAEFIAGQLKNRISFRQAMKKAIELAQQAGTKGVQVQIAGRLDGNEIARVEWSREGKVPLQTIRAKIDYCSYPVRTIYGVLGIKVWIFRNND